MAGVGVCNYISHRAPTEPRNRRNIGGEKVCESSGECGPLSFPLPIEGGRWQVILGETKW